MQPDSDHVRAFREAMGSRADTVHLITFRSAEGKISGMTATAVAALSLSPPSLLVCVNSGSRTRLEILRAGVFGVNVLRTSQLELALTNSRNGADKTLDPSLVAEEAQGLPPVLANALANLQCRIVSTQDAFTHTVIVGEVLGVRLGDAGPPLLHYLGGFSTVGERLRAALLLVGSDPFSMFGW